MPSPEMRLEARGVVAGGLEARLVELGLGRAHAGGDEREGDAHRAQQHHRADDEAIGHGLHEGAVGCGHDRGTELGRQLPGHDRGHADAFADELGRFRRHPGGRDDSMLPR